MWARELGSRWKDVEILRVHGLRQDGAGSWFSRKPEFENRVDLGIGQHLPVISRTYDEAGITMIHRWTCL